MRLIYIVLIYIVLIYIVLIYIVLIYIVLIYIVLIHRILISSSLADRARRTLLIIQSRSALLHNRSITVRLPEAAPRAPDEIHRGDRPAVQHFREIVVEDRTQPAAPVPRLRWRGRLRWHRRSR